MLRHTLIKPDGKPIQGRLPVLEWPLSIICMQMMRIRPFLLYAANNA